MPLTYRHQPVSFPGTQDIFPLDHLCDWQPRLGKRDACQNMATKCGFCLVGLGQLLSQDAQSSTQQDQKIHDTHDRSAHSESSWVQGQREEGSTLGQTSRIGPVEAEEPRRL